MVAGDLQQPGQLVIGERASDAAAVTALILTRHHLEGVALGLAGLDGP
ncbi:hypothetical protein [Mucisphaera sp.]